MEKYTDQVRAFAGIWIGNFNGNEEQATESLSKLNELLISNPEILPFLSKPKNQEVMGEMVQMIQNTKSSNPLTMINKLSKAAKKLDL